MFVYIVNQWSACLFWHWKKGFLENVDNSFQERGKIWSYAGECWSSANMQKEVEAYSVNFTWLGWGGRAEFSWYRNSASRNGQQSPTRVLSRNFFLYHFVQWHKISHNTYKVVAKQNYLPRQCHFALYNKVWHHRFLSPFSKIGLKFIEQLFLLLKFNLVRYYSTMYTEECLEHFKDYNDIIRKKYVLFQSLIRSF